MCTGNPTVNTAADVEAGNVGEARPGEPSLCLHSPALTSAVSEGLGGSTAAMRESRVYLPGKINGPKMFATSLANRI